MFEYLMPLLVMPTYEALCLTNLSDRGGRATRVWSPARGQGHFGIRLQHRGRHLNTLRRSPCRPGLSAGSEVWGVALCLGAALMVAPRRR